MRKRLSEANPQLPRDEANLLLQDYLEEHTGLQDLPQSAVDGSDPTALADYDKKVSSFLSSTDHSNFVQGVRTQRITDLVSALASENQDAVIQGTLKALRTEDPERRAMVVEALKQTLLTNLEHSL